MTNVVGQTRGGKPWVPTFISNVNQDVCIGCGRCYKVCSRNVFDLVERECDDDEDDQVMMVMNIADGDDCIGCGACSRVCTKRCHEF
ncbi:ferredoxin III, nif-specific [Photobacterium sp. ZSDE20]|uniref:Ferredoxin III, nif-specific n=1 Tax=Photobacterium pectinilyticum TaxID=2906793 RepID=A0ABT1N398_9GAMM|nr:ferredoxin III, nif-specific [Photobacterium sp. ZSDE20]MCQ1058572.1 ferredoxin III, nif-specific [Photobacterium sp. ZSDE20]MDD1826307.1 ferredoxin III, nif-specific [Photobacterium sp. ZSDE20]